MITGIGYWVHGSVDHALLRLCAVRGDRAACDAHAEAALALCAKLGARPIMARVQCDWAQALLDRADEHGHDEGEGGDGDASGVRARARALLEAALETATEVGMPSVVEHAQAQLARCRPGPHVPATGSGATAHARAPASAAAVVGRLEGEYWTLTGCGAVCRVRDSRGLQMLGQLLAQPGRDLHVLELSGALEAVDGGDAGEVLDRRAIDAYRARLRALDEETAEADAFNDRARRERLDAEAERLRAELAAALGLSNRERRTGSAVERARVNVRRRVALALRHISRANPELGRHLSTHVRTGVYCAYEP